MAIVPVTGPPFPVASAIVPAEILRNFLEKKTKKKSANGHGIRTGVPRTIAMGEGRPVTGIIDTSL